MDWETYQRARASLTFVSLVLASLLLLVFEQTTPVHFLQEGLSYLSRPVQSFQGRVDFNKRQPASLQSTPAIELQNTPNDLPTGNILIERIRSLEKENAQLASLLQLQRSTWKKSVPARVVARDPSRWFEELIVNKGSREGILVGQPVVAIQGQETALIGRVIEVQVDLSKVMLLQDALSAVPSTIAERPTDDGVVEGSNDADLWLRYLHRDSAVRIGDRIVTSGLGGDVPPGILIGTVQDVSLDLRQLFLQARLRPVIASEAFRTVLILTAPEARP